MTKKTKRYITNSYVDMVKRTVESGIYTDYLIVVIERFRFRLNHHHANIYLHTL